MKIIVLEQKHQDNKQPFSFNRFGWSGSAPKQCSAKMINDKWPFLATALKTILSQNKNQQL